MSSGISITKGQALFVPAQSEDDDSEPLWWRPPSPPSDTLSTCASEPSTASSQDLGEDYIPYDDLVEFVSEKLDAMQRFPLDYREGRDRHPDITPFAFNQVRIDGRATQTNGSWICFPENDPCISVLHKPAKYIAISAPMPDYFSPFMRMLQQEAVPLIVSLSAFSEAASLTNPDQPLTVKTDPYLPYEEGEVLEVTNQYTITCLKVHPSIPLTPEWTL